jgi:hypothetical protein
MADFYAARAGTNAGAPLDGFLTAVHIAAVSSPLLAELDAFLTILTPDTDEGLLRYAPT